MDVNQTVQTPNIGVQDYKPIAQPKPDTSLGQTLQTIGGAVEGVTEVADTHIKDTIKDSLYKSIDTERDDFSSALQSMKRMVAGDPMNANAQATDKDLMPDQPPPPPQGIQRGLSTVQNLQSGYNGNKISETMYYQRLNTIAKQMRSDYPGYRDYIDSEVSKISGGNPANEYLKSMINDLNHNLATRNKDQEYYEKAIVNSGYDMSQQVLEKYKSGQWSLPQVQDWLASNATRDGQNKRAEAAFTMAGKQTADIQSRAENLANTVALDAGTRFFHNSKMLQSDPTSGTSSEITDMLNDLALHPEKRDAVAIQNIGIQLQALRTRNVQETTAYLNGIKTQDGKSVAQVLGPAKIKDIVKNQIDSLYDAQLTLLNDQNVGLVHSIQNTVAGIGNNKALDILSSPDQAVRNYSQTATAVAKIMPNMASDLQMELLGHQPDMAKKLLAANHVQIQQMLSQTGDDKQMVDSGYGGKVYTFKTLRDQLSQGRAAINATPAEEAAAINRTLKVGSMALRSKDPTILDNATKAFFDPANRGSLNNIVDDGYDAGRGVIVKGRTGAFGDLTAPDISKNIYKRANEGHTLGWENYKNWAHDEAVQQLTTMAQTWNKNEDDYAKNKFIQAAEGTMPTRTDHHFYWNTDNHQIGYMDLKGQPIDPVTSWRANPDMFAVRNANVILSRLREIALTEGTNPDAFLFKTLKDAGWSPKQVDTQGKASINTNIMRAVTSANTPPEPAPKGGSSKGDRQGSAPRPSPLITLPAN